MLQFTRIQITAILVTVLVICGFAVPNFVSDETVRGWPDWAQRRITLAPELGGGESVLYEVDRNDVRRYVLASLSRDVSSILHDAHINLARPVVVRSGSIEVRPLAGDFEAALAKLRALYRPFNGVSPVEATDAGGGLIRLTPTEASISEYVPPIVDNSIRRIRRRLFDYPATVEREGANRLRVQMRWSTLEALGIRGVPDAPADYFQKGENDLTSTASTRVRRLDCRGECW